MKHSRNIKKILTTALVVIVIFFSFGTPRVYALPVAVPVGDVLNVTTHTSRLTLAGFSSGFQDISKMALDALAYAAGQMVLNQLTENTISWIQGGFHGSPSFAVDTKQLEQDLIDAVAGELIGQIKDLSVCEFRFNYVDDLTDAVQLSTKKKKAKYIPKCPFPDSLTTLNFYASDAVTAVNSFGWTAFGAALQDSGNPYSVQVATAQELEDRKEESKKEQDKKLSWSNGYADLIDTTDCNYPEGIKDYVTTGAGGAGDTGSDAFYTDPTVAQPNTADPATVKALQKQYCKTTTPGNIVSDQLSETLGLDMDRLGFADNMNKIIAAVLNELTQQTVRGVFGSGNQ